MKGMVWEQNPDPESAVDLWWSAPGQEPGIGPHGKIGGISEGVWGFGDTITRARNFDMIFLQASSNSGSGTWNQSVFDTDNGIPEFAGGKWMANVVPIPATLWLFSSGLISLGFYRKSANRPR